MAKKKSSVSSEAVNALSAFAAEANDAPTGTSLTAKSTLPAPKRGLKGIPITAVITLLAAVNPKRAGCAAEARFALYETGMTQEQFLDAGGTTPDMAYDAAHGYISVDGYAPPKMVEPTVREPKAPKEPKAKREKIVKEKSPAQVELESAVQEETVD